MKSLFNHKNQDADWTKLLPLPSPSAKDILIEKCKKLGVIIYIADAGETTEGIYSQFRQIASEAELQRRIEVKKSVTYSKCAYWVALISFIVSLIAFIKSFF